MKKLVLFSFVLLSVVLTTPASKAQSIESSWFEIELLAFSRSDIQPLLEKFPAQVTPISTAGALDLLSPLYQPDLTALATALPGCSGSASGFKRGVAPAVKPTFTTAPVLNNDPMLQLDLAVFATPVFVAEQAQLAEFSFRQSLSAFDFHPALLPQLCPLAPQSHYATTLKHPDYQLMSAPLLASPQAVPLTPAGSEQHQSSAYLAPETALALTDLAYQLKHRAGHQLLLHTVWRQQLGSKRQSVPSRWFGGRNFAPAFDYAGRAATEQPDLSQSPELRLLSDISRLEQQLIAEPKLPLSADSRVQQASGAVWQLDGLVRLYSERMLFAETEFNLRKMSADGQRLQTFYSKDQSRLLIGNIHYLDHPHLGLVLQIRRFTPPSAGAASTSLISR
ncbi:CsiV family protein [Rheinheimera sp.]|uniref:CsiV family protein n=1 Tax=Rheinheimera sp. TaxID=1869214 RepID=UPI002FDDC968